MANRKEEMQAALELRPPKEAVPYWELHFHCWDQASRRHFVVGTEYAQLTPAEQERAIALDAEIMASVAKEYGFSAVTIPDGYWEIGPGEPTYYWMPQEGRLKLANALFRLAGSELMVVAAAGGILGMPGSAVGYEEFCLRLYDAPEEVDEMARQRLQSGLETIKQFCDVGVGAVYTGADQADNRGPFFTPKQLHRFVLPYLREWADSVKRMDLYAIMHTDGNIMPILDDLIGCGIQALQAIDPTAGMDIRQVQALVGDRICLCGNVDPGLIFTGPAEEIYNVTRDLLLDCKAKPGFILGSSNAVFHETPIEHYLAMVQAFRDYGSYAS